MEMKRFGAKDVQEAFREVKEVPGEEAIILSTRKIRKTAFRPGSFDYPILPMGKGFRRILNSRPKVGWRI